MFLWVLYFSMSSQVTVGVKVFLYNLFFVLLTFSSPFVIQSSTKHGATLSIVSDTTLQNLLKSLLQSPLLSSLSQLTCSSRVLMRLILTSLRFLLSNSGGFLSYNLVCLNNIRLGWWSEISSISISRVKVPL